MEQQFTTVDAYFEHLKATQSPQFAEVALVASMTKSTLRSISGAIDMSNPEKALTTMDLVANCFTATLVSMTKLANLADKSAELTDAADKIYEIAEKEIATQH